MIYLLEDDDSIRDFVIYTLVSQGMEYLKRDEADVAIVTCRQELYGQFEKEFQKEGLYSEVLAHTTLYVVMPENHPLRNSVVISNPLGEDTSIMRTTALPSMMEILSKNYNNRNSNVALFEIAREYIPTTPD